MFVLLLPPANEVWGKVILLHLSVILFTGGRVGAWSRGVPGPRRVPAPGGGGVCSQGVPASGGMPGGDPPGRLLLRAVRTLLECILVDGIFDGSKTQCSPNNSRPLCS